MKKILCLIMCLLFASLMLVSCGDDEIGKVPDHYPEPEPEIEEVSINLYIIVDDATSDNAIQTVSRMIAQHTLATYYTEVNVKYVSAEDYESVALNAVTSTGADAANIVLVNSYEFMTKLYNTGKLENLAGYLQLPAYGTLNVKIPTTLIDACVWNVDDNGGEYIYAIPNNHIIDDYQYLVIDREVAEQQLKYSLTELLGYTTYDATEALRADMEKAGYNPEEYVYIQNGAYSLKGELEADNKNVCNIIQKPTVDLEEAYSSAFAIVDTGNDVVDDRAMEIIYALNSDVELRNLLQYGVYGTNYTLSEDGEILMVDDETNTDRMNLEYTGNIFVASYCDEIGWTAEIAKNGEKQNADSVFNKAN